MNISKINITEYDLLWLKECYEKIEEQNIDPKIIKVKLIDYLPPKYNEYSIDNRLISGCHITLVGIYYLDKNSEIIKKVEEFILYVRKCIIKNPEITYIEGVDILNNTKINKKYLKIIIRLLNQNVNFINGISYIDNEIDEININSEKVFDEYLAFRNIETLVKYIFTKDEIINNEFLKINTDMTNNINKISIIPDTAFIIMSIEKNNSQNDDVFKAIKEIFKCFNIKAVRADEIEHSEKITDVILDQIKKSEYIFADISGEKPNVYYEIGYAHAIGKKPMFYRRTGTKIHFDLANHNIPEYDGVYDLKEKIKNRLTAITGRNIE